MSVLWLPAGVALEKKASPQEIVLTDGRKIQVLEAVADDSNLKVKLEYGTMVIPKERLSPEARRKYFGEAVPVAPSGQQDDPRKPNRVKPAPPTASPPVSVPTKRPASAIKDNVLTMDDFLVGSRKDQNGNVLLYRLFVPDDYTEARKYPLVLYLHAAGESAGTDNLAHVQSSKGRMRSAPDLFCRPESQARYPCFFLAPQQPEGELWACGRYDMASRWMRLTVGLIESLQQTYTGIDPHRIYATGVSSGGKGALDALAKFPGRFAAAVPIAAGDDPKAFKKECVVPVWFFYGENDSFTHEDVSGLVTHFKGFGVDPRVTVYKDASHGAGSRGYSDPGLLPWLFAQRLADKPSWSPK